MQKKLNGKRRQVAETSFKVASITPVLKKQGLNPADTSSYRPISNLSVLSKTVGAFSGSAVATLFMYCWSASYATVRSPATSLYWDRPTARSLSHPGSCRPWRFCSTSPVGVSWTYLLRSTRSTTTFCCRGYRQASALAMLPSSGSSRTWPAVDR